MEQGSENGLEGYLTIKVYTPQYAKAIINPQDPKANLTQPDGPHTDFYYPEAG